MRRLTALLLCCVPGTAAAQVVESTAGPLVPFMWQGNERSSELQKRSSSVTAEELALYATSYLGPPGQIETTTVDTASRAHHYPVVRFIISAVTRLSPSTASGGSYNLKRLNAHILIEPLDASKQSLPDRAALHVLDIQPNTVQYDVVPRDSTSVAGAAVNALSRNLLPQVPQVLGRRIGPLFTSFTSVFHHVDSPTQVSYFSDDREFGWTWYEHDKKTLEGAHATAALLEVTPNVRYLRVIIHVVTDWRHQGSWRRQFEQIIDLGDGKAGG